MCGIAGIFDRPGSRSPEKLRAAAMAMAEVQAHRGPDDSGVWVEAESGIALGHRRLAIIDCDPSGHQPMVSADGRYVISYNGEIYNFRTLAGELRQQGHAIVGGSDTAVLLAACAAWGVEKAVSSCVGMFAFGLWDRERRELTLVRDRLGIKPLYWARFSELFLFGSQLKALRLHEACEEELDLGSVVSFLRHAYVPAPHSIFKGVRKLLPGTMLTVGRDGEPTETVYWDLRSAAGRGAGEPHAGDYREAKEQLAGLLTDAVRQRMVADVPLGVFLSGGIDSSTVTALMQSVSPRPVRSFSIGFDEQAYDEARHARAVAAHLGTDHTELYVRPDDARDLIPRLPEWYDEPFADSSQLPTLLLSRMTRQHVTVALSGDGGDEVFAGYNRYFWAERLWRGFGWMPKPARDLGAAAVRAISPSLWDRLGALIPSRWRPSLFGDKMHKAAGLLNQPTTDDVYRQLVSQWPEPGRLVPGTEEHKGILWDTSVAQDRPDFMGRMQLLDMATYLPDDILTKVDRASMAFSLEARVPLLDHRVVEFAWRLPRAFMVHAGKGKRILRDILYGHVPRELVERPKMGFGVPIDSWLRGPLRDWAEELLSERRLRQDGIFDPEPIRTAWASHLSGQRNLQYALWTVLMFQSWRIYGKPRP